MITHIRTLALALILTNLLTVSAIAHGYGHGGMQISYNQPNGQTIQLIVKGGQNYARTITKDGYTVVFNRADQAYYYARLDAAAQELVPTKLMVGRDKPKGLAKNIRLSKQKRRQLAQEKQHRHEHLRIERWNKRVQEAKKRHAQKQQKGGKQEQGQVAPSSGEGEGGAQSSSSPLFAPVTGNKVGLTIICQFPDDPNTGANDPVNFPTTQAKVERYCNEIGYTDDGNTGSIRDYFLDQSNNILDYTQLVTNIVTLPNPRNYYNYSDYPTNNTIRDAGAAGRLLVTDAITVLNNSGFNYDSLTLDGSNVLATNVFFAGPTSGVWAQGLWPHRWVMSPRPSITHNGNTRYIFDYQITNISNSAPKIGTFIHESGHVICDYPDLYDYGGESAGVGRHCVMASGNGLNGGRSPAPINAYFKDIVGWANITDLTPTQYLNANLPTTGNIAYRIQKPGTPSEFFIVENRGTGDKWATHVPDKGIMVWHVDDNVSGNNNEQMTQASHYQVSLQ